MTMDMHMQHRGGLRVEAAAAAMLGSGSKTASPATSDSSDRTGSPGNNISPSASPSLLLPLNNNNNNNTNNNNSSELNKQSLMTSSNAIIPSSGPGAGGNTNGKNSIKRSFDVAFLMAPDDLSTIKKRHQQQEQQLRLVTTASLMMRSAMTPLNVSVTPPQPAEPVQHQQQVLSRHILQQHPPSLMIGHGDVSSLYRRGGVEMSGSSGSDVDPCRSSPEDAGSLAVRSAFTKVTATSSGHHASLLIMQNNASPSSMSSSLSAGGLSPDHTTYQNSLSPSPRSANTPTPTPASPPYTLAYQPPPPTHHPASAAPPGLPYGASPFYVPQSHQVPPPLHPPQQHTPPPPQHQEKDRGGKAGRRYSPPAVVRNSSPPSHPPFPFGGYPKPGAGGGAGPGGPDLMGGFQKLRPSAPPGMLYPESLAAYTNLAAAAAAAYPFGAASGFATHQGGAPPSAPVPSPSSALAAAAVVSASLLPPTFAALSLPAQNVCAKCNVSFRMTSDLVYHMRAHHKSDHAVNDPSRRRREQDKLKCPVCSESFRERHHLTRHMTAHQDKEGDVAEETDQPQPQPEGLPSESKPHAPHAPHAPQPPPHAALSRRRSAGAALPAK